MTRSNRKKNHKRVKKLIKKLKDECCHAKKHYEEKINALEMELWNKQYHITSILGYLASISYNPWDRDVYRGFAKMCDGEFKKTCIFPFVFTLGWNITGILSLCMNCFMGSFDNDIEMFIVPCWWWDLYG